MEVAKAQLVQNIHAEFVEIGAANMHLVRHLQAKLLDVESAVGSLVPASGQGAPPGGLAAQGQGAPLFDPWAAAA